MLDEGCAATFRYFGIDFRTVLYVERELFAAAQLVTLMENEIISSAPVWSDLTTFDYRRLRGKVDSITAGFPCQPHSVAGKREGTEDERWLWPNIKRAISDSGCWCVFLENVPGLLSSGGMDSVLCDLAELGFHVEWTNLSAKSVGASHKRDRVFIFAVADSHNRFRIGSDSEIRARGNAPSDDGGHVAQRESGRLGELREPSGRNGQPYGSDTSMDDSSSVRQSAGRDVWPRRNESDAWKSNQILVNTESNFGRRELEARGERRVGCGLAGTSDGLADAYGIERRTDSESSGQTGNNWRDNIAGRGAELADAGRTGSQGNELRGTRESQRGGTQAYGSTAELCEIFAPGPTDPRWRAILEGTPWLAPAIESGVLGMVDGDTVVVGESRRAQLRAVGNSVVPLCVATAFVALIRRYAVRKLMHD